MNYSVLLSVYKNDNPKWLEEAIQSILNQTIKTNDFVIVKDGPVTEEINKIINKYKQLAPINIVNLKENMGLGLALNKGIKACKNNLIARIDADDISKPNRIEKQLLEFKKNGNLSIVGTMAFEFKGSIKNIVSKVNFPLTNQEIKKYAKKRNPFCHPSVMLKKDSVLKAGNYRDFHLCEDYDLWIRMISLDMQCLNINEYLHYWRVGDDFYKRRSGIKYLKSILKFLKLQKDNKFLTKFEYYKAVIIRSIVYLMPNCLRKFIYKNFLRNKVNS